MSQHCSDNWYMSLPSAQSSREETFFKKNILTREVLQILHFPRVVYTILPSKFSNLRRKTSFAPKIFVALL